MRYWTESFRVFWVCLVLITSVIGASQNASAFGTEEQKQYEAAKEKLRQGAYVDALRGFKKILPMVVGDEEGMWQILVAVALTYEKMGEPVHSAQYYGRFLARIAPQRKSINLKWKQRYDLARETLAELEAFLLSSRVHVRIESVPTGAEVIVDGVRSGADMNAVTPFETYITPGNHTIAVMKEGVGSAHEMLASVLGKSMIVHLRMGEPSIVREWARGRPRDVIGIERVASNTDSFGWDVAGWSSIGIGLAVLGTGLFFTLDAADSHTALGNLDPLLGLIDGPTQREKLIVELEDSEFRAGVLYSMGGLALTTGVLLLFAEEFGWVDEADGNPDIGSMGVSPVDGGFLAFSRWSF
jgi:hypothetical protein